VECSCNWRDRQTIEDGCGNAMDQTHASNHPATGTANNQGSQSRRQKKEDRAMTAQHSRAAHNTHSTRGGGWWGSGDGLLKPEPVVLADQDRPFDTTASESRPNVPTERARAWAAKLPTKLPRCSVRSHRTTVPGLSCPVLYTAEEAKAKRVIRTGREASIRVVRRVRASTEACLIL
jgi:hypothetical protein